MSDFFKEIKPYIDILSEFKNDLIVSRNTPKDSLNQLRDIHDRYIRKSCRSCNLAPVMRALVAYYEKTPKRGRKKAL